MQIIVSPAIFLDGLLGLPQRTRSGGGAGLAGRGCVEVVVLDVICHGSGVVCAITVVMRQ